MKEAVIFVGIPASGKSSYFATHLSDTHVRINRDMLVTKCREDMLLHTCLAAEQSFVMDNTNPTREGRERLIALAKAEGFEVTGIFFDVDRKEAEKKNKQRLNPVPTVALRTVNKKMERPTLDEGYDNLNVFEGYVEHRR